MVILFVVLTVDEVEEFRGGGQQSLHKPVTFFIFRTITIDQGRSLLSVLIRGVVMSGGGCEARCGVVVSVSVRWRWRLVPLLVVIFFVVSSTASRIGAIDGGNEVWTCQVEVWRRSVDRGGALVVSKT